MHLCKNVFKRISKTCKMHNRERHKIFKVRLVCIMIFEEQSKPLFKLYSFGREFIKIYFTKNYSN